MCTRWLGAVGGIVALAGAAARADFIREVTTGTFEVIASDEFSLTASVDLVVVSEIGGWGIQTISGEVVQTFTDGEEDPISGFALFQGPNPEDVIEIILEGFITKSDQPHASFAGEWETTSTGGAYEGLTGFGNFSGSNFFTSETGGLLDVVFQGDLVPAPASICLPGLAALAATRRRRI
jgi:hypothetical protein